MKILYFNYMNSSVATMIRTLEIAKGASENGADVDLVYMHRYFRPPQFFYEVLEQFQSPTLRIHYQKAPVVQNPSTPEKRTQSIGKVVDAKPRLRGLYKQILASLKNIPRELEWIKRVGPDVVVARPDHIFSFVISTKLKGIPLVLENDGPVEELDHHWGLSSKWVKKLDLFRARSAGAMLYISDLCKELWVQKRVNPEKLFFGANGANPDFFKPLLESEREAQRSRFGISENDIVFGFSGNQRVWHGVQHLIKEALPILEKSSQVKLMIIGALDDPKTLGLEQAPVSIQEKQIILTGAVPYPEMPQYIDMADILVLPYQHMDFFHFSPMKLFEAMSMSKRIVASDIGQISTLLAPVASALLFDPKREDDLGEKLKEAIALHKADGAVTDSRSELIKHHTWNMRGISLMNACRYAVAGNK